jgi:hypothetical protein
MGLSWALFFMDEREVDRFDARGSGVWCISSRSWWLILGPLRGSPASRKVTLVAFAHFSKANGLYKGGRRWVVTPSCLPLDRPFCLGC